MSVSSARVEIYLQNVEGRIVGAVPGELLDQVLNPRRSGESGRDRGPVVPPPASVYDFRRQTFLLGALPDIRRILRREGIRFRIRDQRGHEQRLRPEWRFQGPPLREYQVAVVERALRAGDGTIDVGTGGGKTLVAAAVIARLGLPTLYIVTTRALLAQAERQLAQYLGRGPAILGSGQHRPGPLTVALVQALATGRHDLSPWSGGGLVFDEGHHAAAPTYVELIREIRARHNFFLSAVPFRHGTEQKVFDALTGGRLADETCSTRFLIQRGYSCPAVIHFERCRIAEPMNELPFRTVYERGIVFDLYRNRRIARLAARETAAGASVLVLVERIAHGRILRGLLPQAAFVSGRTSRSELHALTEAFRGAELPCLIATAGLFQEGVSIDGIQVLIHAGGLKSRTKILQAIGRGLRRAPGKEHVLFVDFLDDDPTGILRRHSLERLRILGAEGFSIPSVAPEGLRSAPAGEIHPAWTRVPGTRRFLLIDAAGRILDQAPCVVPSVVPRKICRRCSRQMNCKKEGTT